MRPQAQDGEGPAVFAQQQADLVVVRVGVQGLVVLLVLHLVLRGVSALSGLTGLRGARLRGALLPPLGATVLKPHLNWREKIHVADWSRTFLHHQIVVINYVGINTETKMLKGYNGQKFPSDLFKKNT